MNLPLHRQWIYAVVLGVLFGIAMQLSFSVAGYQLGGTMMLGFLVGRAAGAGWGVGALYPAGGR